MFLIENPSPFPIPIHFGSKYSRQDPSLKSEYNIFKMLEGLGQVGEFSVYEIGV